MKKKIISVLKKQWLLLWIIAVSAALLTVTVFAEYPGTNNFIKRVVVFDESSDVMFTSNLLTTFENDRIAYQPYLVEQLGNDSVEQSYNVEVFVWNYDINGKGNFYSKQIDYNLEIAVCDMQGNVVSSLPAEKSIQVVKTVGKTTSSLVTFTSSSSSYVYNNTPQVETLATNDRSQIKYTVRFSRNWDLKNDTGYRVRIKATPTPAEDYTDIKPLAAIIGLKEIRASGSAGWKYYIKEQRLDADKTPPDYDAYNLVLNGSGSQSIEIEWDPAKIAFNKNLFESNGAFSFASGEVDFQEGQGSQSGWNKLVISADSYSAAQNYRNRYDLQFYKVNGEIGNSWNFISGTYSSGISITINIPTDAES